MHRNAFLFNKGETTAIWPPNLVTCLFSKKGIHLCPAKRQEWCQKHTSILAVFSILEEENSGYRKGNAAPKKRTSHL